MKNLMLYQHFLNSTFISTLGPHYLDHCAIYKLGYQKQRKTPFSRALLENPLKGLGIVDDHTYVCIKTMTKALQGGV
jgi:hypothetical protein